MAKIGWICCEFVTRTCTTVILSHGGVQEDQKAIEMCFDSVAKVPDGQKMVLPNPHPKIFNFWPRFAKKWQKLDGFVVNL